MANEVRVTREQLEGMSDAGRVLFSRYCEFMCDGNMDCLIGFLNEDLKDLTKDELSAVEWYFSNDGTDFDVETYPDFYGTFEDKITHDDEMIEIAQKINSKFLVANTDFWRTAVQHIALMRKYR